MGIRGELHSEKLSVAQGKRTYFFNVKQNRHGDAFLVIAENILKFDDRIDRQQIVIYEEHLSEFRYALNKAVSVLHTLKPTEDTPATASPSRDHSLQKTPSSKKYKIKPKKNTQ